MTYTDTQLKQALAKMLPERVYIGLVTRELEWHDNDKCYRPVLDTELLHLCWLVEETLTPPQAQNYFQMLPANSVGNQAHATWQQRVIALAKVKGVEIV